MKFLITGGAGFIGSAVIRHLLKNTDHQVMNVDKLTYAGNLESLCEIENHPNYQFVKADICDANMIRELLETFRPNKVMHLAAESHVDRSIDGPADFIQTNIIGTFNLLECSRIYFNSLADTEKSEFIFHHISTDEVYGDLHGTDDLFTENTPYNPSSPYSASKAGSDHLVRAWARTFKLPVVVTNCSNNYGPFQFPEKLIPVVILNALRNQEIPVYGNGAQIRDWLYVDDHAEALVRVASIGETGETYNIGGHNEVRNIDVVKGICGILNELKPSEVPYESLIRFVTDRPGHDRRYAIDATKIADKLNWTPKETFQTGLRKTVEWYLHNLDWVEHILDGSYQHVRLGDIR